MSKFKAIATITTILTIIYFGQALCAAEPEQITPHPFVELSANGDAFEASYYLHSNMRLTLGAVTSEHDEFIGLQIGEHMPLTDSGHMQLGLYFGPSIHDEQSERITGWFQFLINTHVTYYFTNGWSFGANYLHISNATIRKPNDGLDEILMYVSIPMGE